MTRLERDAKARVFLDDKDTITTWLVSSVKFLRDRPRVWLSKSQTRMWN